MTCSAAFAEARLTAGLGISAQAVDSEKKCALHLSPGRTLRNYRYALKRTYTDAWKNEMIGDLLLEDIQLSDAGLNWDDVGVVDGVTYHYTVIQYRDNVDNPRSTAVSDCVTKRVPIMESALATSSACYLSLSTNPLDAGVFNPYVSYEWGYGVTPYWIGADGGTMTGFTWARCGNTAVCSEGDLTAGTTYFFAVRAKNDVTGIVGLWSSATVACRTF